MATSRPRPGSVSEDRLGVWIFGARGGLATTMISGALAVARGRVEPLGLLTETDFTAGIALAGLGNLVFGGHEIRPGTLHDAALEVYRNTGAIPYPILQDIEEDLAAIDARVRRGTLANAGRSIQRMAGRSGGQASLRAEVRRLQRDVRGFLKSEGLTRCVCVDLTSTEPQLRLTRTHRDLERFEAALDADDRKAVRPSALYAYVAASLGLPFLQFTPSNAALIPAVRQLFDRHRTPYMGRDGKTGETLVKSALAPMFRYRNLRVLAWQGYNLLGDRDGAVLADAANRRAKVQSKDAVLGGILGYPVHTHVGIDYVPSLSDLKTAWDFIHFQGFLGFKMSMQFVWQGCDAVLAAPIVLDMVRLADLAHRRGEHGPMRHLACFFKTPLDVREHDLHEQWRMLLAYLEARREGGASAAPSTGRRRP